MQLFKKLFKAMGAKTPMQKLYTAQKLPQPHPDLARYPGKEFLAEQGVFAYRLVFMVTMEDAPKLVDAIRNRFASVGGGTLQEGEHHNAQGESIHFAVRSEFNGATVEMLTNSDSLVLSLDALQMEPPPPWVAFPDIDPDTLGSRQGAIDYWWNIYWRPFWAMLNGYERERFKAKYDAQTGWIEYLALAG